VKAVISYFLRIMYNTIKGPRLQYFNKNKQTSRDTNKGSNKRHTYVIHNITAERNIFCLFKLSIENTRLVTWSVKTEWLPKCQELKFNAVTFNSDSNTVLLYLVLK
jgi:hypothetical protein